MGISLLSTPRLMILISVLILCIGCGYQFRAGGKPVGIEIESLAIPLIESSSSDMGFEADFTRIIRQEFISHANVPITGMEQASAILSGRIHEIKTQPLTYDSLQQTVGGRLLTHETTSSRMLKIRLEMSLTDRTTGKVIWHDNSMEEEAMFDVETDPLATQYNQKQALMKIASILAKRVYLKTMERF